MEERGGVERRGEERGGVERRGEKRGGVERRGEERGGVKKINCVHTYVKRYSMTGVTRYRLCTHYTNGCVV